MNPNLKLISAKFLMRMSGKPIDYEKIDYNVPIPNSLQQRYFTYDEVREFNQPAYKRTYISEKSDLTTNGWVDWVVGRVQEIGNEVFWK